MTNMQQQQRKRNQQFYRRSWKSLILLLVAVVFVCDFVESFVPPTLITSRSSFSRQPMTRLASSSDKGEGTPAKPILVVGASGKVGRLVVKQLVEQGRPVRALVRNTTKAQDVLPSNVELVQLDLGQVALAQQQDAVDKIVQGCECIISVSGSMRFSKPLDFLPWRLFNKDVSSWCSDDTSHPYYTNYLAQVLFINAAKKYDIQRFVRLTGLSASFGAFNPVSIIFGGLLSMTTRYHVMTENYLRQSGVPYLIMRPGGLADDERNTQTTNLQVDPTSSIPPPARVGRADVAALAVASCNADVLPPSLKSLTLATRWVGPDVKPRGQGTAEDGCPDAVTCLKTLLANALPPKDELEPDRPHGLGVGLVVYTLVALVARALWALIQIFM